MREESSKGERDGERSRRQDRRWKLFFTSLLLVSLSFLSFSFFLFLDLFPFPDSVSPRF